MLLSPYYINLLRNQLAISLSISIYLDGCKELEIYSIIINLELYKSYIKDYKNLNK